MKSARFLAAVVGALIAANPATASDVKHAQQAVNPLDFPVGHRCYLEPNAPACPLLAYVKNPDWTLSEDLVVLPHRGFWGFGDVATVPENSVTAFNNVATYRYSSSEADFMPTTDGLVMSHDYVLTRLTQVAPLCTDYYYNLSTSTATALTMRNRFFDVTSDNIVSGQKAIEVFSQQPAIIYADIKQKPDLDHTTFAVNWVKTLERILKTANTDQLYEVVVKTPYSPAFILKNLDADARCRFMQVLWMPQVASNDYYNPANSAGPPPGVSSNIKSSADFVDEWNHNGLVLAYETNYKAPDDSRLKPFARNGVQYANILDYIKQTTNHRGGVFAEEPVGERGVVNRNAVWSYKDAATDMRGDFVFEAVQPQWGNFIVVTTDRPDVWESVKESVWGANGARSR
jgi:hypothetical protein